MRPLEEFEKRNVVVEGELSKIGYKGGDLKSPYAFCIQNVIVKDLESDKQQEVDHIWIRYNQRFNKLNPDIGDKIQFTGIVDWYQTNKKDYTIVKTRNYKKIS